MRQQNLDRIEANSSHDTITRITKERVKKNCKSPDTSKLHKVCVPSLRLTYFCKNLTGVAKRIKAIKEMYPDREIVTNKPAK